MRPSARVRRRGARGCASSLGAPFVVLLSLGSLLATFASAQSSTLPARSQSIDVIEDGHLRRGYWYADPGVALDTYVARRTQATRSVEFRSDLGSLVFEVAPDTTIDFVVVLEDGRRCPTRITAPRRGAVWTDPAETCVIPFRLGDDNKIHIEGTIEGSPPLDLMFDTGADTVVLYPSGLAKVGTLPIDGTIENAGFSGTVRRETSSDIRISIAGLEWDHEQVMVVEQQVERVDGIVGWVLFEDKVLDIDFGRSEITVRNQLPESIDDYARLPFEYRGSLPYVAIGWNDAPSRGAFVVDTGSSASLHVTRAFVNSVAPSGGLTTLGTSRSGGLGGGRQTSDVVSVPSISLGGLRIADIPVHVARSGGAPGDAAGTLGMDLLQRFSIVLDSKGDALYLRPGPLFDTPFQTDWTPRWVRPLAATVPGVLLALVLGILIAGRRRLRATQSRA